MSDISDFKFTEEQAKNFATLQTRLAEYKDKSATPRQFARFFRGNGFDVETTVEAYGTYMKWRADKKIDNVLENATYPKYDVISKLVPYAYHGFDNEGRPIYFEKTGQIDCDGLIKHVSIDEFLMSHIWGMENIIRICEEQSKKLGKTVDEFTTVLDLSGMGMGHRNAISYLRGCAEIDAKYYPERVAQVLVLNTPWVMPALYNLIKPFLGETIKNRIHVLGGEIKTELLEHMPMASIPNIYGGNCTKCEGKCVPIADASSIPDPDAGFEKKNVGAGSKWTQELKCGEEGGTFTWFFKSVGDYDVDFSIKMITPEQKAPVNVKIKSRCVTSKGSYTSTGPCTLHVEFDNTFSYFNSKDLLFLLDVCKIDVPDCDTQAL